MKKLSFFLCTLIFATFVWAQTENTDVDSEPYTVRVGILNGPSCIPCAYMMENAKSYEDTNLSFETFATPQALLPKMIKNEIDIVNKLDKLDLYIESAINNMVDLDFDKDKSEVDNKKQELIDLILQKIDIKKNHKIIKNYIERDFSIIYKYSKAIRIDDCTHLFKREYDIEYDNGKYIHGTKIIDSSNNSIYFETFIGPEEYVFSGFEYDEEE